jgi:CRISPR/Cas system-associated exonuclease Cas4 (RecB family)
MRFFYGHILEAILLYLCKEAGHKVKDRQLEVELEGVKGHIDAVIDGALVDVKSASDYSFKKFKSGSLENNDPFGYIAQISGYMEALDLEEGGFLTINKNSGEICFMEMDELMRINASDRVKHLKKVVNSKKIPERCFSPVPDGQSGNRILSKDCVFCDYKEKCWQDANEGVGLRIFRYSNGYRYFTHIVKEPNVEEVL